MIKTKAAALMVSALIAASMVPAAVYASAPDLGEWHDFYEEEEKQGLTPEGNLTLVDDYGEAPEEGQQFITLVTKNGNYFYLIIDRDSEGENTVHFLNMVDERDLFDLLDEDQQSEYLAQIEALKAEKETAEKEAEEAAKFEETVETKPEKKKVNLLPLLLVVVLIGGGVGGWFLLQTKKKKKEESKPDPDAFYDEDFSDFLNEEIPEAEEIPEPEEGEEE